VWVWGCLRMGVGLDFTPAASSGPCVLFLGGLVFWFCSLIVLCGVHGGGGGGLSSSSFWLVVCVWGFVLFLGLFVGGVVFALSVWSVDAGLVVRVCAPWLFCFWGALVVGVGGFWVFLFPCGACGVLMVWFALFCRFGWVWLLSIVLVKLWLGLGPDGEILRGFESHPPHQS
jgi:hypothetical protein